MVAMRDKMNSELLEGCSQSRDCDTQDEQRGISLASLQSINSGPQSTSSVSNSNPAPATNLVSSGYYDAEKCRAFISNQIKISKIDRFAAQVSRALEVESNMETRLGNILNMFERRSAQVTREFTLKCKLGLQRHRQDRITNQPRKSASTKVRPNSAINGSRYPIRDCKQYSVSNDLLYGKGAKLVQLLLSQTVPSNEKHIKRKGGKGREFSADSCHLEKGISLSEDDYLMSDLFEPDLFVKRMNESIRMNKQMSGTICARLGSIRQLFERLASEHRDKVDVVYAAEEERQAASVIRRSAYNLSIAAIRATSTPVHVNSNQ